MLYYSVTKHLTITPAAHKVNAAYGFRLSPLRRQTTATAGPYSQNSHTQKPRVDTTAATPHTHTTTWTQLAGDRTDTQPARPKASTVTF